LRRPVGHKPGWPDWANARLPIVWLLTSGNFFENHFCGTKCFVIFSTERQYTYLI
jgi:hypothetical protein